MSVIIPQTASRKPAYPCALQHLYNGHRNASLTVAQLIPILETALQNFDEVFVVIDAVDECLDAPQGEQRSEVLQWLTKASSLGSVRCLFTSQNTSNIVDLFRGRRDIVDQPIGASENYEDLKRYVNSKFQNNRSLKGLEKPTTGDLENEILGRVNGMYVHPRHQTMVV